MSRKFALENPVETARVVLQNCGIPHGADFHALSSSKVDSLLAWADRCRYRKPRHASGSRARYFHDMLQRNACGITKTDARRLFGVRRMVG